MDSPSPLWKRLVGFTLLPAIAAISPLLVLPIVSRTAGPSGWSSAIAGESVGTFAAIAIAYGWTTIGPALISIAGGDEVRGRLYREAVVVRLVLAVVAVPVLAVLCWLIASPGHGLLSILMGIQGALIALSFTWFAVGIGDPRAIAVYDAIPRLVVAVLSATAILNGGAVELYPLAGILVTLVGTALYTNRILRRYPSGWPALRDLPRLFRTGSSVALNDAALGAYSAVPAPLVNVTAPPTNAAGFASADKMVKLGQFLPLTLANALQAWIGEVHGRARTRRIRIALLAHGAFGLAGWVVLAACGTVVSTVLFGQDAAAPLGVLVALGLAFAMYSLRTSMTRHLLFPAGEARAVMTATLIGTILGIPAMIGLAHLLGPLGVAIGYALTELTATSLLLRRSVRAIRRIEEAPLIG